MKHFPRSSIDPVPRAALILALLALPAVLALGALHSLASIGSGGGEPAADDPPSEASQPPHRATSPAGLHGALVGTDSDPDAEVELDPDPERRVAWGTTDTHPLFACAVHRIPSRPLIDTLPRLLPHYLRDCSRLL